jgi:ribosome-associated heat shock protein Hsp15
VLQDQITEVRLDKWLWAARFYKTRQLSATAVKSNRVEVNGRKAKPSKMIKVNDSLSIRKEQLRYEVTVLILREKRVSADLAAEMYDESNESIVARTRVATQLREQRKASRFEPGRPSKKDRRSLDRLRRGEIEN